jgi:hypothetical protein
MQTDRDAAIVEWVGRIGAAGAGHVMGWFSMGRSWAYARLGRLVADGLLEQRTLLYRQPGLYLATAEGLRWRGLERLGVFSIGAGSFQHSREVAAVAVALHKGLDSWGLVSERELRVAEAERGGLIASAQVGGLPGGRTALHRPDLAIVSPDGGVAAVEVELSVKASRRLLAICRGYARARHIEHVYYLAAPAAARAVARAVAETRAEDRITVFALDDIDAVIAVESAGAGHARV